MRQKTLIIIAGIIIIALLALGFGILNSTRQDLPDQETAPLEDNNLPELENEGEGILDQERDLNPLNGNLETEETIRESTPEERENRTVSPSDAAYYSDKDLPEE